MTQPHEVRLIDGKKIDWRHSPLPNAMCRWTKKTVSEKVIKGSFRTLCHLNHLNNLAIKKYGVQIEVLQSDWNTTVAASAGTHDFDSTWDLYIPGISWWEQQKFFRAHGFGCWYRHPPLFGNHIHGFTLPLQSGTDRSDDFKAAGIKVGRFVDGGHSSLGHLVTSSQISDYYNHAFGLSGQHDHNSDSSWFPANIKATIFDLNAYVARRSA